jgi:hypothetical protein
MRRVLSWFLLICGLMLQIAGPSLAASGPSRTVQNFMRQRQVSRHDCLVAVSVLLAGRNAPAGEPELIAFLRERRVAHPDDLEGLETPATRGYASLLFMRGLGEKGGLFSRISRSSRRYAYKHMKHLQLVPEGGDRMNMSGPELFQLLSLSRNRLDNAQAHQTTRRLP